MLAAESSPATITDALEAKKASIAEAAPVALAAKAAVAPTIKEQEADEPILRENPNRFVLFPLKYHESE